MRPTVDAPAPCAFMAELVGLLDEATSDALPEHLDRLERDAYGRGAPEATVEAIRSARALLRLSEAPVVFIVRSNAVH